MEIYWYHFEVKFWIKCVCAVQMINSQKVYSYGAVKGSSVQKYITEQWAHMGPMLANNLVGSASDAFLKLKWERERKREREPTSNCSLYCPFGFTKPPAPRQSKWILCSSALLNFLSVLKTLLHFGRRHDIILRFSRILIQIWENIPCSFSSLGRASKEKDQKLHQKHLFMYLNEFWTSKRRLAGFKLIIFIGKKI